ncbi:hypothetical protein PR202_gb25413 [Eleusine coracana subsp. coracana]|uniref:Uncharacterized protein n=1 Tax=Eleusine coracana subsp. coracana TaxID=191504 RepID=A0AAV5FNM0_ELECO|nr:hypothetical protein PR202_gb25413 [Eleusine coracana subsp. coracana]
MSCTAAYNKFLDLLTKALVSNLCPFPLTTIKEASKADYLRMFSTFQPYHSSVAVWDDDDMADSEDIVVEVVQNWHLEGKLSGISLHKSLKDTDSLHGLLECRSTFVRTTQDWFEYMTCSQL